MKRLIMILLMNGLMMSAAGCIQPDDSTPPPLEPQFTPMPWPMPAQAPKPVVSPQPSPRP